MLKKFYKFHLLKDRLKQFTLLPFKKAYSLRNFKKGIVSTAKLPTSKSYTVFWSIDAGLTYHYISHCIVAKVLQSLNHDVILVRCHKHLKWCTIMDALDVSPNMSALTKERICSQCTKNSIDFADQYKLPSLDISELIPNNILNDIIQQLNKIKNVTDFTYDGINFGKIALGEVFRTRKLYDMDLSQEETLHVKAHVIGSITNYLAFENLKTKININRVVYFNDYANVLGIAASAKKSSIPISNISQALINNIQRGKLIFGQALSTQDQFFKLSQWDKLKSVSLAKEAVKNIGDDLLNRISKGGSTIFSPVKSTSANQLYSQLNLDPNKKLLVAFTSSLDEAQATNLQYEGLNEPLLPANNPFKDQIEWIKYLIDYVKENKEIQLVVRIHPREATNGFEKKISKHLLQLRAHFKKEFERVFIIWPEDGTSSYDLAELADLILISWTSVGLEMARFGAPVLGAFEYCPYPKQDVIFWATSKEHYFEKLQELLTAEISIERVAYAFRWFNLVRLGSSIDVSDIAPTSNFTTLPEFKMPLNAKKIEEILIHHKNVLDINYNNMVNDVTSELSAIKNFLKKAVWYLFTGTLQDNELKLLFTAQAQALATGFDAVIQYSHDGQVKFMSGDVIIEKKSPLIARIAKLLT